MSGRRFDGTDLPNAIGDQAVRQAVSKSTLDLLDKINTSYSELSAAVSSVIQILFPLPSPPSNDISFTVPSQPGLYTIYIPAANLVAGSIGQWTLTLTTGKGSPVSIPISSSGDSILSGNLVFDIYVDSDGNISSKDWSIRASNSFGQYNLRSDGSLRQFGFVPQASRTFTAGGSVFVTGPVDITFPRSFLNNNYAMPLPSPTQPLSNAGLWTGNTNEDHRLTYQNSFYIWCNFAFTSSVGLSWEANGSWY